MKTLTAICLVMFGCSSPAPPDASPLHQSFCLVDVPDNQVVFIQSAIDEWNERTGVTTWAIDSTGCDATIHMVDRIDGPEIYVGIFRREKNSVEFESVVSNDHLRHVILHELGHVAGLSHSPNVENIMYENSYTPVEHLTEDDLAAFKRFWFL